MTSLAHSDATCVVCCTAAHLSADLCLQHMAAVRQVFNPLEKDDVIMNSNALCVVYFCLQHMAAVRQVFNPLEKDDVIGITNYIDVGIQLHVPLAAAAAAADGKGASAAFDSSSGDGTQAGLRLAASWQVGD
jgi:uncharacterized protein YuzB (UPF0349 family)